MFLDFLTRAYVVLFRGRIVRSAKTHGLRDCPAITRIWASSDAVYLGAYGYSATVPIESDLIDAILPDAKNALGTVAVTTIDPNPVLAGYAIEVLHRLGRTDLIYDEAKVRQETVVTVLGCARIETNVGEFARMRATPATQS